MMIGAVILAVLTAGLLSLAVLIWWVSVLAEGRVRTRILAVIAASAWALLLWEVTNPIWALDGIDPGQTFQTMWRSLLLLIGAFLTWLPFRLRGPAIP
ncbi:hypothetical protein [Brevundimonas sp.]|uniref:hypothetical protein n=1 Tax=Brevundimonas sp. TaxID=1871086 RepID=UPI003BAD1261